MSQSTRTKQEELLSTQTNVENNHNKNSNLTEREKIEGTPFTLINFKYEDNSTVWYIVMGDYRMTQPTETKEETLKKLETEKWLLLLNMVIIAVDKYQKLPEPKKEQPITGNYKEETTGDWKSPREIHKEKRQKYNPQGNITDKDHDPLMDE